ncbi:unnamed protein product, partial [Rotaria sp. Silwood1]
LSNIALIDTETRWKENGHTMAGGNGKGAGINQLNRPLGLCVDDDQTIYIADYWNHRIIQRSTNNQIHAQQLNCPTDVIIDKENDSLIICDSKNRRVIRWNRQGDRNSETIISDIDCFGLKMDNNGCLYITDCKKHQVRRYRIGEFNGIVIAGGNRGGNSADQLYMPQYICIGLDHTLYVSDSNNHRVMKWTEGAKRGIVVAGGHGSGSTLTQLSYPRGVVVDPSGTVYIADSGNNRIIRWPQEATQGSVVVGEHGPGAQSNQLDQPSGLSFDHEGNLYVTEENNHRVQKFYIDIRSIR